MDIEENQYLSKQIEKENKSSENGSNENEEVLSDELIETSNQNQIEVINEESQQELIKIDEAEKQKSEFIRKLSLNKELQEQKQKSKLELIIEKADYFANFLIQRKNQLQIKRKPSINDQRKRGYTEDDENILLNTEKKQLKSSDDVPTRLDKQPSVLKNGELKNFQLTGLNWLISLYEIGINGILADEMGLGKTVQTISLIAFLKEFKNIHGPFLVIGPKSTLGNWFKEFKKWVPSVRVLKLVATKEERLDLIQNHLKPNKFDVCLTSYEGVNICLNYLKKFKWKYIIIDEAHRIKNEISLLSLNIRQIPTNYKLLLTGTPLQNNLHELWSLLNFIMPDIFSASEDFDILTQAPSTHEEDKTFQMVQQLQRILKPFMLRRTKNEALKQLKPKKEIYLYVKLTNQQVDLYKNLLLKRSTTDNESKTFYLNIIMQLRKVCNHPYLFEGIEEAGLPALGEHLVENSGKLKILDKLLTKLKQTKAENGQQHQMLIYSQMTKMLDILEDYCNLRKFNYCRIDGDTDLVSRERQIAEFTRQDTTKTIFLLSTRAGGLGINLETADTVVLYDSDWNPQVDLQAMDRAHRIGQQNQVNIYRLITENSIEEKIVERQILKLKWDSLVIQKNNALQKNNQQTTKQQLKEMITYGAHKIFKSNQEELTDEQIDNLLKRGEEKAENQKQQIDQYFSKYSDVFDLTQGTFDIYDFQNENFNEKKKQDEQAIIDAYQTEIENNAEYGRTRREKKTLYQTLDDNALSVFNIKQPAKPKVMKIYEHQLFQKKDRLIELLTKEAEYKQQKEVEMKKKANKKTKDQDDDTKIEEETQEDNGLTVEENEEKQEILNDGFISWNKNEYYAFIQGCERFGRKNLKMICQHIGTKSLEDVEAYSKTFWERIQDLTDYQRILKNIEKGEQNIEKQQLQLRLLDEKCKQYNNPKEQIEFHSLYNKFKNKNYTINHDRLLLFYAWKKGIKNLRDIKLALKQESKCSFDFYLRSRNEQELQARLGKLIKCLEREHQDKLNAPKQPEQKKSEGHQEKDKENKEQDKSKLNSIQKKIQKVKKMNEKLKQDSNSNNNSNNKKQKQQTINQFFTSKTSKSNQQIAETNGSSASKKIKQ